MPAIHSPNGLPVPGDWLGSPEASCWDASPGSTPQKLEGRAVRAHAAGDLSGVLGMAEFVTMKGGKKPDHEHPKHHVAFVSPLTPSNRKKASFRPVDVHLFGSWRVHQPAMLAILRAFLLFS